MVFHGFEEEEHKVTEPMETMSPKRRKPLHNFNLPFLKWGNQQYLRCSNDAIRDTFKSSTSADQRSSKSISNESTEIPNQPIVSRKRKRLVFVSGGGGGGGGDHHHHHHHHHDRDHDDEEGIAVVREKLMHDLKTATDRMKDAILREECEETETLKSWNLRLRQKEIKAAPVTTAAIVKRDFCSPAKIDGGADNRVNVASRLRRNINSNKKTERPKFSVQLSKKEIDEDFMAILGRQSRHRPTKRPKLVQKQINSVFPGLWLREVNADMYKVLDANENGKTLKKKGKGKCFDDDDDDEEEEDESL
ncbi:hypothetical protein L195_g028230 [Trifolium pratense]|uniref:DUF1639 family protein n=1 Tax=Trifolium pratense TaxID=57577 RepID=A0A2K3L1B9_TRIPR|nr:hypothetical protein L195_g028230 [Trifolium pratense]